MSEIDNCPLCGGGCEYKVLEGDPDVGDSRDVICTRRCGYRLIRPIGNTKEQTIAAHNRRVMSDEVRKALMESHNALGDLPMADDVLRLRSRIRAILDGQQTEVLGQKEGIV